MEYSFYVAEVLENATIEDNRLRVRILPNMEGINSNLCPVFPSFFKDSLYTGNKGDYVWVICDDEFSMGYVFGLANYNTYPDRTIVNGKSIFEKTSDNIPLSIPKSLRDSINESVSSIETFYLDLSNAKVTYWDNDCIHYIERSSGGKIIAFRNGTFYILRPDEFVLKIGNSSIRIDSESISMSSNGKKSAINIQSDYVGLGNNAAANVMINDGKSGAGATKSSHVYA